MLTYTEVQHALAAMAASDAPYIDLRESLSMLVSQMGALPSVVRDVVDMQVDRAKKGKAEYGHTVDRQDYTEAQWADELRAELMDAAVYVTALRRRALANGDATQKLAALEHKMQAGG